MTVRRLCCSAASLCKKILTLIKMAALALPLPPRWALANLPDVSELHQPVPVWPQQGLRLRCFLFLRVKNKMNVVVSEGLCLHKSVSVLFYYSRSYAALIIIIIIIIFCMKRTHAACLTITQVFSNTTKVWWHCRFPWWLAGMWLTKVKSIYSTRWSDIVQSTTVEVNNKKLTLP